MDNGKKYFGLSQTDYDKIIAIIAQHKNINKVILYGSRAKGNYRAGSDIDISIVGDMTWQELNQLESELDDLMLPYLFDISLFYHIDNEKLIDHINRVGTVFYPHKMQEI